MVKANHRTAVTAYQTKYLKFFNVINSTGLDKQNRLHQYVRDKLNVNNIPIKIIIQKIFHSRDPNFKIFEVHSSAI